MNVIYLKKNFFLRVYEQMKKDVKGRGSPVSKSAKKRKSMIKESKFPNGFVKTKEGTAIPIEKGPRGGLYYKKPKTAKATYLSARKN
jgi:hypothetical protein